MKRATIARNQAVESGVRTYFTGLPCKRGHVADRLTSNGTCTQCLPSVRSAWKTGNERVREGNAIYYERNRESVLSLNKEWRDSHPDEVKNCRRRYYEKNKPKYTASSRARKEHVALATPSWADMEAITAVYVDAGRLSEETGIKHDVDHIIPLRGKFVCGLHVHNNLRPIPASENRSKGNRCE